VGASVFTGYRLEELRVKAFPGTLELLAVTDVLVDGPYLNERPEVVRNWVGSENQQFHYLTNKYECSIELDSDFRRGVELRITMDGYIRLNGWPADVGGPDQRGRPRAARMRSSLGGPES